MKTNYTHKTFSLLVVAGLLLFSVCSHAKALTKIDHDILSSLAYSKEWLNILHYGEKQSQIDDESFFLAVNGARNPLAELEKTLTAISRSKDAYCRYPSRRGWLLRKIPELTSTLTHYHCEEFEKWMQKVAADSTTLVLASSYLNSPSSMYGHTFLRFDNISKGKASVFGSLSVSFAAVTDETDGFMFAYNGLFGGYPGKFSALPYFEKVKEYVRFENRDVWEYKLNLNAEETRRIIAHLWEVDGVNFDYYFFDENCSYRILELIEIGKPSIELTNQFGLTAIPVDTVKAVNDLALVESIDFRPSNQTLITAMSNQLEPVNRDRALALGRGEVTWDSEKNEIENDTLRFKVAELAYKYARFIANEHGSSESNSNTSFRLLKAINTYSGSRQKQAKPILAAPPEAGHDSRSLMLSAGYRTDSGEYFSELELKASYHELLDNPFGYPGNASLNIGGVTARVSENENLTLEKLSILEIRSLSPTTDAFDTNSWGVSLGLHRYYYQGDQPKDTGKTSTFLSGDYGKTFSVANGSSVFALASSQLAYNRAKDRDLDLGVGAAFGYVFSSTTSNFLAESRMYLFSDKTVKKETSLGAQMPLGKNLGLRFTLDRINPNMRDYKSYTESKVSIKWYFR